MLGLARDGAVFPLCPGVLGGTLTKGGTNSSTWMSRTSLQT
jgi:hypothetical protein